MIASSPGQFGLTVHTDRTSLYFLCIRCRCGTVEYIIRRGMNQTIFLCAAFAKFATAWVLISAAGRVRLQPGLQPYEPHS